MTDAEGIWVATEAGEARSDVELAEPRAEALIESLRAFGYSPETAIADLVDNSLSAGARHVGVRFHWAGADSWIAIHDDGRGMTTAQLREAMRPGSSDPRDERATGDLGRFGLGLKTASFSQCRQLTVTSSAAADEATTRVWNLDHVVRTQRWELLTSAGVVPTRLAAELLSGRTGTVVVWENMDRVLGTQDMGGVVTENHFYRMADRVRDHLRMTFHRFMSGTGRITFTVNGRQLTPWDPFAEDQPATQVIADEYLPYRGHGLRVRSFVLPHTTRLSRSMYEDLAGPRGWVSQQGFYVYRNRRLIVSGSWLGLRLPRDEVTKLARVQLDLPNSQDEDWQIDVRKSVARSPATLATDLRRIAEVTRRGSTSVFRHRGRVVERARSDGVAFAWEQVLREGRVSYRVNRSHPLVQTLARAGANPSEVEGMLRVLEETVPVPLILLEQAGGQNRHSEPFEGAATEAMRQIGAQMIETFRRAGMSDGEARLRMSQTEPFADHPGLVDELMGGKLT